MSAEDYPYDPALEGCEHNLNGLDKLRAISDRRTAHWLFKLHEHIVANEDRIEATYKHEAKRKAIAHRQHLVELAKSARRGAFGVEAKVLAEQITQQGKDDSNKCLEHLAEELRRGGFQRV